MMFRIKLKCWTLCVTAVFLPHVAWAESPDQGPNWCAFAEKDLRVPSGEAFKCDTGKDLRCIKMNNYGCTKNFSARPYPGELTQADGKPVTDVDHHAIYEDPKWSLRAAITILSRYYRGGKKNAISIAETWAPWCDTDGSKLIHEGWGRTCHDGPGPAPASFQGPRCTKPENGVPRPGQCGPCNCPNILAAFYSKDTDQGATGDLQLFDDQGMPKPNLGPVLRRVVWMELGFQPLPAFVTEAIEAYRP